MTAKRIKKHLDTAHKKMIIPLGDFLLGKIMSKKLTVFLIATIFTISTVLTGEEWVEVAKWYFGAQGAVDIAGVLKGTKKVDLEEEKP